MYRVRYAYGVGAEPGLEYYENSHEGGYKGAMSCNYCLRDTRGSTSCKGRQRRPRESARHPEVQNRTSLYVVESHHNSQYWQLLNAAADDKVTDDSL